MASSRRKASKREVSQSVIAVCAVAGSKNPGMPGYARMWPVSSTAMAKKAEPTGWIQFATSRPRTFQAKRKMAPDNATDGTSSSKCREA